MSASFEENMQRSIELTNRLWLQIKENRDMNMYVGNGDFSGFSRGAVEKADNLVIFDIDGCISDDEWRIRHIDTDSKPINYDPYHKRLQWDSPTFGGASHLRNFLLSESPKFTILFVTARPVLYWAATVAWLEKNFGIQYAKHYYLYMRPIGNVQKSVDLKKDVTLRLVAAFGASGKVIQHAFDDRRDIVDMYRSIGIQAHVLDKRPYDHLNSEEGVADQISESDMRLIQCRHAWINEQATGEPKAEDSSAAGILLAASKTYAARNADYKDNYKKVGAVMKALFPDGVAIESEDDHNFYHLFELMIVKLTRFVNSGLKHKDSIHDLMVYAAMCEALVDAHDILTDVPQSDD